MKICRVFEVKYEDGGRDTKINRKSLIFIRLESHIYGYRPQGTMTKHFLTIIMCWFFGEFRRKFIDLSDFKMLVTDLAKLLFLFTSLLLLMPNALTLPGYGI